MHPHMLRHTALTNLYDKTQNLRMVQEVAPVSGYLSQSDPRSHFGLGRATRADRVEIRWPNGRTTTLNDVKANQIIEVSGRTHRGAQVP